MEDLKHDLDELRKVVIGLQRSHIKLQVKVYGEESKEIYKEEDKKSRYDIWEADLGNDDGFRKVVDAEEIIDEKEMDVAVHQSILSMGKYKEGEIKEALDEFIKLLYEALRLNYSINTKNCSKEDNLNLAGRREKGETTWEQDIKTFIQKVKEDIDKDMSCDLNLPDIDKRRVNEIIDKRSGDLK